jgi:hypothetical protein
MQRAPEIPLSRIPKAVPWEQWEALKYKVSSDPIKPVF